MSSVEYRVQVSTEDITRIRSQFESLDLDGNGQLTAEEASRVLEERGIDYDRQNIINMIQAADTNSDGFCSWAEFLAIMLDIQFHTERNQKEFDFADKDGDGKISFSEMVELFKVKFYLISSNIWNITYTGIRLGKR